MKFTLALLGFSIALVAATPRYYRIAENDDSGRDALNAQIENLDAGFRDECSPLPSKYGVKRCQCEDDDGNVEKFSGIECKIVPHHAPHPEHGHDHPAGEEPDSARAAVLDEIESLDEGMREECQVLPKKGGHMRCKCPDGDGLVTLTGDDCKEDSSEETEVSKEGEDKSSSSSSSSHSNEGEAKSSSSSSFIDENGNGEDSSSSSDKVEKATDVTNGRKRRALVAKDKIREKAKSDYAKVVQELNNRFKNYKENCFPRPKGCLCEIGKGPDGRPLTKRIKSDEGGCKTTFKGKGKPRN